MRSVEIPKPTRQWNPRSRKARDLGHPHLASCWLAANCGSLTSFGMTILVRDYACPVFASALRLTRIRERLDCLPRGGERYEQVFYFCDFQNLYHSRLY